MDSLHDGVVSIGSSFAVAALGSMGFVAPADSEDLFETFGAVVDAFGFAKNDAIDDFPVAGACLAAVFDVDGFADSFFGVSGSVFNVSASVLLCFSFGGDAFGGSAFGAGLLAPCVTIGFAAAGLSALEVPQRFVGSIGKLTLRKRSPNHSLSHAQIIINILNILTPQHCLADACPSDCNAASATPG